MEYIYAAMLLHKAGKQITEDALHAVLKAAGVDADPARIKATVAALKEVDIEKTIKEASIAAPAAPVSGGAAPEKKAEVKEVDKAAEEENAAQGLGALFG